MSRATFVSIVTAIITLGILMVIARTAYWLFDVGGWWPLIAFSVGCLILSMWYAISTDIKKGLYRLSDLPGALFKKYPGAYD